MSYAVWTLAEENAFVDFLVEHKSTAGDRGNFKASTLQQALPVIAVHYQSGAAKTVKSLQNKWASMWKTFCVVQAIKGVSGWTWDDNTGASITPDTAFS
ncbi:hypothetical protein AN958_04114 [Leucoagaricus sp. SymC.cos]|nr:hypothetical protein AN958_04114 [Leucoagaricus sp. SymC.cos]